MSRLFAVVATALLAFVLFTGTAQATQPPCVPDCFQDPYGPAKTKIFEVTPGCFIKVTYHERFACGQFHDVAIVEITILSPFTCNFYNTSQFVEIVSRKLIASVPGPLPQDSCVQRYRITRGSCWRSDTTNPCGDTIMVPCPAPGCCIIRYEVCGDSLTGNRVRPMHISSPGGCPDTSQSSPCRPACDTSIAYGLRGTSNVNSDASQLGSLTIAPNPAMQTVRISAPTSILSLCDRIAITDLQGRLVVELRISETQRSLGYVDADVANLGTGAYIVTCSGTTINLSNQFSILR